MSPSEALCWKLSRFKKDGLSNIWGAEDYPTFMQFIGIVSISASNIRETTMPYNRSPSKIERGYFSKVKFYEPIDVSTIIVTNYIKCKDHLFNSCIQSMKSLPDYQSSSNSIYKSNVQCPSSSHQDVEVVHSSFLSSKKLSAIPFIKLENKFKYIKDNTYCNHGM